MDIKDKFVPQSMSKATLLEGKTLISDELYKIIEEVSLALNEAVKK